MGNATKKILIPQKKVEPAHSPYLTLSNKYDLNVEFLPFTSTMAVSKSEFRKFTINIVHDRLALIFVNKRQINYFFHFVEEIKAIQLPEKIHYFCATPQLKNYLQKYRKSNLSMNKRQIIAGTKSIEDLFPAIKKRYKSLHFVFPCSTRRSPNYDLYQKFFKENGLKYKEMPTYETKFNNISDLAHNDYDMILFFSPLEVKAMLEHFPKFRPNHTKVALLGKETAKVATNAGWDVLIQAPSKTTPSLVDALDRYFKTTVPE
ncbi:MAG: uroporphyrinogen-III synthase [Bacteroidota bacterium]